MNLQKMAEMMKKAQREVEKKLAEFDSKSFEYPYQNGALVITIQGNMKITKINLDKTLVDPEDKTMLEEMLVEAINHAIAEVEKQRDEITSAAMPQMPGLF